MYSPVWRQLGLPFGNFTLYYTKVISQKWMNPKFLYQDLPLFKLKFYIPRVLNTCTCDPFYSTLTCNDREIYRHFHGHCQLILNANHSTCFSLHFTWKKSPTNKPTNQPTKETKWFDAFHTAVVWPCLHSETLVSWPLTLSRTEQPLSHNRTPQPSAITQTELHIFLRMMLSCPVLLLLYLNFSGHSGILLESSSILLLSCLKYPVCRMIYFKYTYFSSVSISLN